MKDIAVRVAKNEVNDIMIQIDSSQQYQQTGFYNFSFTPVGYHENNPTKKR